jgi:lipopolysaccharide transport system ATP-binding protein
MFIVGKAHDIGDYTYGHPHVTFYEGEVGKLKTGKFCSISKDVTFFVSGYHNINCVTKYPFSVMSESGSKDFEGFEYCEDNIPKRKNIEIGNDVYIGDGAKIMGGVKIGDGAVIAAYSVVCNDVKPYEVVGGNPAKHIKFIFSEEQIKDLLDIAWWDWDFEKIKENCKYLTSENVDEFIKRFKNKQ